MAETGVLYIVATPIGNLADLAPRAASVLGDVQLIAAEDTRHSRILLDHAGVDTPMVSLHEHNEESRIDGLVSRLSDGDDIALISDAGTPLVSDPGFRLVSAAREQGVSVRAVPGPCAAVAALSIAGLPTDRFTFAGFLPAKRAARREKLAALATAGGTLIFYESGRRVAACIDDMRREWGGDRPACIAREMTKLHEESCTRTLDGLAAWLDESDNRRRGEFVIVVSQPEPEPGLSADTDTLLRVLLSEMPASAAARIAAKLTGASRQSIYRRALALEERDR